MRRLYFKLLIAMMLAGSAGFAQVRSHAFATSCEQELGATGADAVKEFNNALNVYLKTLGPKSDMALLRIAAAATPINPVATLLSSSDVQFQNFFDRLLKRLSKDHWAIVQKHAQSWSKNKVEIENIATSKREETAEISGLEVVDVSALVYEKPIHQVTVGNTSYVIASQAKSNKFQLIKVDLTTGKLQAVRSPISKDESKGIPAIFVGRDGMVYVAFPEQNTFRLFVTGPQLGLVPINTFKTLRYGFHSTSTKLPNGKIILVIRSGAFVEFYEFNESKHKFQFRGEVESDSVSRAESDFFQIEGRTFFMSQKQNRSIWLYEFPDFGVVKAIAPLDIKLKDKKRDLLFEHAHPFTVNGESHVAFYTSNTRTDDSSLMHVVNFGTSVKTKRTRFYTKTVIDATVTTIDAPVHRHSNLLVVQKDDKTFILNSEENLIRVSLYTPPGTLESVSEFETGPHPMYLQAWRDENHRDLIGAVDDSKLGYYELSSSGHLAIVDTYKSLKRFRGFHGPLFLRGTDKTFVAFGNEELMIFATKKKVMK